jgi:sec-independent protein translocase protein TatA
VDVGPAELIIVLLVVLVLFGGAKLPQLARSLGQAQTEFKKGRREGFRFGDADETEAAESAEPAKAEEDPAPVAGDPATGETATADGPDAATETGTETTDPPGTPPA